MEDRDRRRLLAKVARLYHHSGLRQTEIADRLRISQTRVSRLLQQAETEGIVQTVVVPLVGLDGEIEEDLEARYSLAEVHVIETVSDDEPELAIELGAAAAAIFATMPVDMPVVGFTSWSRTLRHMIAALRPVRTGTGTVVEMLGGLGPPDQQYEAARATQRLATLTGAEPVFLRTPGVVASGEVRRALLAHDAYARQALDLLDKLDLALSGSAPARSTRRCRRATTSSPRRTCGRWSPQARWASCACVSSTRRARRCRPAWTTSSPASPPSSCERRSAGGWWPVAPASTPRCGRCCSVVGPTRS